jgi:membrane-associated HD superfamily phosphohydrolase
MKYRNIYQKEHKMNEIENLKKREEFENAAKKIKPILIVIICILVFYIINMIFNSPSTSSSINQSSSSVQNNSFSTGDIVSLKGTFAGVSENDFDRVVKLAVAKDSKGMFQLIAAGKAFIITDNSKARIIQRKFSRCEIRMEEGEYEGLSGWIPSEMVK